MNDIDGVFETYRGRPGRETLRALLLAHQDIVYTICLTVLQQRQDAEDCAQDALLRIAEGVAKLREPHAFRSWLYRVTYHTAVQHLRRRQASRRTDERRVAMTGPPSSEDARDAIHEAMIRLPDEDRLLLVEHYFEKATLEELGQRKGVSAPAIWKRIDRALGRLKRGLAGAGFGIAAGTVAEALESITPTAAPTVLVTEAVLTKAALVAAGGIAMGTKSLISGMTIAAVIVGGVTATGGYIVGARRSAYDSVRVKELENRVDELSRRLSAARMSGRTGSDPQQTWVKGPDQASREQPPSNPATPDDSATAEHVRRKPEGVKIGRPEKPDIGAILIAPSWEKFYEQCKENGIAGAEYEDLILRRLAQELGLDEEKSAALMKLFKAEQEAATKAIIGSCGGAVGFEKKMEELATNSKAIFDDWRQQRDVVRRTWDSEYLRILTWDKLPLLNEHLRNSEIFIESSYDSKGVHYLLSGVGKPPK